jgi:DNA-directed RNA polymerase subunit RPC12/RpoP
MKGYYCPNCGKRQKAKLDIPSRVAVPCPECGKTLVVKMDKNKWSVVVEDTSDKINSN